MNIKKYTKEEIEALQDKTDYDRLKKLSEEEIEALSESDPDSLTPSDEDFKKFKKVKK